jgi:phosphonate transport system substrate-binding protein
MRNLKVLATLILSISVFLVPILFGCDSIKENTAEKTSSTIEVLRIGAIPAEDAQKSREAHKKLTDYLEKKVGIKTELFVATDYTGVVEAMRAKKLEIAFFGPLSYVLAADKANAEAYAKEYRKKGGSRYQGLIITHPESGIDTLQDLKGRTFAFVDPASTGGNLIPRLNLMKNGIDPDKDLGTVMYSGGHDSSGLSVKNKKVDAAAIVNVAYDNMRSQGILTDADAKVIFTSDPFPGSTWAWRKDLPDDLKEKIKAAFLQLHIEDPEALKTFAGKVERYEPVLDSDYDLIRETAKTLNLDLSKSK